MYNLSFSDHDKKIAMKHDKKISKLESKNLILVSHVSMDEGTLDKWINLKNIGETLKKVKQMYLN